MKSIPAWPRALRELRREPSASCLSRLRQGRMPSGLIALLDDVATIAKIAAASVDDVGLAVGKAGTKAAGVVIDDTAVTPRYVTGFTPDRELPIIGKIAVGSLKNKLLILLPAALLLIGLRAVPDHAAADARRRLSGVRSDREDPRESRSATTMTKRTARGGHARGARKAPGRGRDPHRFHPLGRDHGHRARQAGRLSASGCRAAALAAVGIVITVAVYGAVGLIVKLDDIGLHLAERRSRGSAQAFGRGLVHVVPKLLAALVGRSARWRCCGSAAASSSTGWRSCTSSKLIPHSVHDFAHRVARRIGGLSGRRRMAASTRSAASIVGLVIGGIIVVIVRQFTKHPEQSGRRRLVEVQPAVLARGSTARDPGSGRSSP